MHRDCLPAAASATQSDTSFSFHYLTAKRSGLFQEPNAAKTERKKTICICYLSLFSFFYWKEHMYWTFYFWNLLVDKKKRTNQVDSTHLVCRCNITVWCSPDIGSYFRTSFTLISFLPSFENGFCQNLFNLNIQAVIHAFATYTHASDEKLPENHRLQFVIFTRNLRKRPLT